MKHRFYSLMILALGLFVMAACSSEPITSVPVSESQAQAQTYRLTDDADSDRGINYPINIGTESDSQVGYVTIHNDAHNLYLGYYMIGNWRLKDAYIHIGRAQDDIPVDEVGRPLLDRFPFGFELQRGMQSHFHMIPLAEFGAVPGQQVMIASFAEVYRDVNNTGNPGRDRTGQSWWFSTGYRIQRPGNGGEITSDRLELVQDAKLEL